MKISFVRFIVDLKKRNSILSDKCPWIERLDMRAKSNIYIYIYMYVGKCMKVDYTHLVQLTLFAH
jgi:hypothetical protein